MQVRYRRHKWRILSAGIGILLLTSAVALWLWPINNHKSTDDSKQTETVIKTPEPQTISSKMLFTGNIFWGRYMNDWSVASPLGIAYPFSSLNEFNHDSYDAWIAGLECPTVAGVNMTSAEMEVALQFNCSPDYLPEAAKWFTAVSLANNHTDNQGVEGFAGTQAQLNKNGIQYFGHYDPRVTEDVCEVISMPATITNDDTSITKGKLPVALCGYHGVFRIPPPESVAVIEAYSKLMPVIALPHMGTEYRPAPDELKINFYRSLIDGGADMVLGDHPHWIQSTESYNGHLIVYSMGNFMFDQQGNTEVERSAAIEVVIKTGDNSPDLLKRWLLLGEKCATYHDTCLADAESEGLTKLNMTFGFDVIGTDDGGRITKPATTDQMPAILQRLNWQSTMDLLQPPYGRL